jgi:hypothetical protein
MKIRPVGAKLLNEDRQTDREKKRSEMKKVPLTFRTSANARTKEHEKKKKTFQ